jgi:archaemetzincin
MTIYVAWLGENPEPPHLLEGAIAALRREFGMASHRLRLDGRPPDTFDLRRQQHSSRVMLGWLTEQLPPDGAKLLGVTDVDLFIPVLTFVFGEAQLAGPAAIVSTARLREPPLEPVVRARLAKEAVHEIGHTFGLVHCHSPVCVMARSPALASVDVKEDRLCSDCRIRYRDSREQTYVAARAPYSDR